MVKNIGNVTLLFATCVKMVAQNWRPPATKRILKCCVAECFQQNVPIKFAFRNRVSHVHSSPLPNSHIRISRILFSVCLFVYLSLSLSVCVGVCCVIGKCDFSFEWFSSLFSISFLLIIHERDIYNEFFIAIGKLILHDAINATC